MVDKYLSYKDYKLLKLLNVPSKNFNFFCEVCKLNFLSQQKFHEHSIKNHIELYCVNCKKNVICKCKNTIKNN